jgi:hypothetical protein
MKLNRGIVPALGLIAILTSSAAAQAPVSAWNLSEPCTYRNLAVFLIRRNDTHSDKKLMTLQEALAEKKIIVHETGSVNELSVENVSRDTAVFIQAGDIVKGGRQDRVLAYDLIVPAQSGRVPLASFCVEAGRWTERGKENARQFSESTGQLPGRALRLAVSSARQQGQVWEKVKEHQDRLGRRLNKNVADPLSPSSLQLTLEDKDLQTKVQDHVTRFEKCIADKPDVTGVVIAINGNIEGAEVYGSASLFRKMWPKLIRTAAVDAIVEYQPGRKYELVDKDEIVAFLTAGSQGKPIKTEVNRRTDVLRRENEINVSIETRDLRNKEAVIHRSYIAR